MYQLRYVEFLEKAREIDKALALVPFAKAKGEPLTPDEMEIIQALSQHSSGDTADRNSVMDTANALYGKTDRASLMKVIQAYQKFVATNGPKAFSQLGGGGADSPVNRQGASPYPDAQAQEQSPNALNNTAKPDDFSPDMASGSSSPSSALSGASDDEGEGAPSDPNYSTSKQSEEEQQASTAGGESAAPRLTRDSTIADENSNISSDDTGNLTDSEVTHRKQGGEVNLVRGKEGGVYEKTQNNNLRRISQKELAERRMQGVKHHSEEDPDNPSSPDPAARYGYAHHHEAEAKGLPALTPDNVEGGEDAMHPADRPSFNDPDGESAPSDSQPKPPQASMGGAGQGDGTSSQQNATSEDDTSDEGSPDDGDGQDEESPDDEAQDIDSNADEPPTDDEESMDAGGDDAPSASKTDSRNKKFNLHNPSEKKIPSGHFAGKKGLVIDDVIDHLRHLSEFIGAKEGKMGNRLSWVGKEGVNVIDFNFKKNSDGGVTIQPKISIYPNTAGKESPNKTARMIADGETHPANQSEKPINEEKIYAPLTITKEDLASGNLTDLNQMVAHLTSLAHLHRDADVNKALAEYSEKKGIPNDSHPDTQFFGFPSGQKKEPMAASWQKKFNLALMSKGYRLRTRTSAWDRYLLAKGQGGIWHPGAKVSSDEDTQGQMEYDAANDPALQEEINNDGDEEGQNSLPQWHAQMDSQAPQEEPPEEDDDSEQSTTPQATASDQHQQDLARYAQMAEQSPGNQVSFNAFHPDPHHEFNQSALTGVAAHAAGRGLEFANVSHDPNNNKLTMQFNPVQDDSKSITIPRQFDFPTGGMPPPGRASLQNNIAAVRQPLLGKGWARYKKAMGDDNEQSNDTKTPSHSLLQDYTNRVPEAFGAAQQSGQYEINLPHPNPSSPEEEANNDAVVNAHINHAISQGHRLSSIKPLGNGKMAGKLIPVMPTTPTMSAEKGWGKYRTTRKAVGSWAHFLAQTNEGVNSPSIRIHEGGDADNVPHSIEPKSKNHTSPIRYQTGAKPSDSIPQTGLAVDESVNGGEDEQDAGIRHILNPLKTPIEVSVLSNLLSGKPDDAGWKKLVQQHTWTRKKIRLEHMHGDNGTDYDRNKMEKMVRQIGNGKKMPPLITLQHGPDSYHVVDGKHRKRAMQVMNYHDADCYVGTPRY